MNFGFFNIESNEIFFLFFFMITKEWDIIVYLKLLKLTNFRFNLNLCTTTIKPKVITIFDQTKHFKKIIWQWIKQTYNRFTIVKLSKATGLY
jgi:hypothetical protein